jgi:hypothetical protein
LPWGTKGTLLIIQSMQDCLDVSVAEWKNITTAMILEQRKKSISSYWYVRCFKISSRRFSSMKNWK